MVDDDENGDRARGRLRGEELAAAELVDLEVLAYLGRQRAAGRLDERRAGLAMKDLTAVPINRARHLALAGGAWQLRETVSVYDAVYVALAEALGAVLVTADARLARAPGPRCAFDVLS